MAASIRGEPDARGPADVDAVQEPEPTGDPDVPASQMFRQLSLSKDEKLRALRCKEHGPTEDCTECYLKTDAAVPEPSETNRLTSAEGRMLSFSINGHRIMQSVPNTVPDRWAHMLMEWGRVAKSLPGWGVSNEVDALLTNIFTSGAPPYYFFRPQTAEAVDHAVAGPWDPWHLLSPGRYFLWGLQWSSLIQPILFKLATFLGDTTEDILKFMVLIRYTSQTDVLAEIGHEMRIRLLEEYSAYTLSRYIAGVYEQAVAAKTEQSAR